MKKKVRSAKCESSFCIIYHTIACSAAQMQVLPACSPSGVVPELHHVCRPAGGSGPRVGVPDVPTPDALPGMLQARLVLARFAWQFPDNPRLARYLYRITAPTLVVWGEHDGVVSTAHGRAYRDGITDAALVVLPHSGHLPHVECPTAFRDAILDYLARL